MGKDISEFRKHFFETYTKEFTKLMDHLHASVLKNGDETGKISNSDLPVVLSASIATLNMDFTFLVLEAYDKWKESSK